MNRLARTGWFAALAVMLAFAGGCGEAADSRNPDDTSVPVQGAESGKQEQPAEHSENPGNSGEEKSEAVHAIAYETEAVALAPGEQYKPELTAENASGGPAEAPLDQIRFASSDGRIVSVTEDGILAVAGDAPIGSTVTVTAQYEDLTAEMTVHVKYSLEDTVAPAEEAGGIPVVTNPDHIAVLVNKQRSLPDGFEPANLVQPDVPFSFSGESEKKLLQEPAARALEQLFAKAEEDGIALNAVSGYRSYDTQAAIYNYNLKTQGEEHTRRYSAFPGTSEHQTGLAMDVSSPSVGNVLEEIFGETEEGKWLEENCAEFGFIIRYPKGKEAITGYAYEPWHLRYVGPTLAKVLMDNGLTMEEYFSESIPAGTAADTGAESDETDSEQPN